MPYDAELADRIRELVGSDSDLREQKMFGGLAFLLGGNNMAIAASGQGGVLVRVDPAQSDTLVATTNARPLVPGSTRAATGPRCGPETSMRSEPSAYEISTDPLGAVLVCGA